MILATALCHPSNDLPENAYFLKDSKLPCPSLVGCVAGAVLVSETERMAKEAGWGEIVLKAKSGYIDGMVDWQDPLYQKIVAQLPGGTRPSDYVTSLEITARKGPFDFAGNTTPRRGGCCG